MDALKVIPQLFFDLIGRVVPGTVAILLFGAALPVNWPVFLANLKDGPKVFSESATFWVLALLVLSYVVGHILSPLSKLLQGRFARFISDVDVIKPLFSDKPLASQELIRFVKAQFGNPSCYQKYFEEEVWIWYDWLRVFVPSAGALAARIRAEYTMYSSFAVTFAIAFLVRLPFAISNFKPLFDIIFLVVASGATVMMLLRSRETERTFRLSVRNFYFVARSCPDPRWQISATSRDTKTDS